jgi:hypothetical protein
MIGGSCAIAVKETTNKAASSMMVFFMIVP